MKAFAGALLATTSLLLAGCGSSKPSTPVSSAPSLTGNWQIQTSATPATPLTGVVLLGDLQSNGSLVSGTFRFTNLAQSQSCSLNQIVALSGSIDSARALKLASAALPNGSVIELQLVIPAVLTDFSTGTIQVIGSTCAVASVPAIGVQLAPVTGTYAGALTPGPVGAPAVGTAGTASLVLSESSTPAADGQYPTTGSLSYTFGTCTGSLSFAGDHSGVGLTLGTAPSQPASLDVATFVGASTPDATQISVAVLSIAPAPCSTDSLSSATYNGTFARQ